MRREMQKTRGVRMGTYVVVTQQPTGKERD